MVTEVRCSSLHRFVNCIGHANIENVLIEEAGQPAKDGTAVGELLSEMIRQKTIKPMVAKVATNGVFFDDEMYFHAQQTYQDILADANDAEISTEERIDWKLGDFLIRGQYDIAYMTAKTLNIDDLKYGFGIVEVKNNWQLIGYAIGQMFKLHKAGYHIDRIRFTIRQPRAFHEDGPIRHWEITKAELMQFHDYIAAKAAMYLSGDKTLQTSESCKYCNAAANCPALQRSFNKAVDITLADWDDKALTNEDIASLMKTIERVDEIIKIKKDSIKALAVNRIQNNQVIPGYSMQQKFGDRKWKDGVTAESIKILTGVDVESTKIMSPAQAEKAGLSKKFTASLTMKPMIGTELVKKDITKQIAQLLKGE